MSFSYTEFFSFNEFINSIKFIFELSDVILSFYLFESEFFNVFIEETLKFVISFSTPSKKNFFNLRTVCSHFKLNSTFILYII